MTGFTAAELGRLLERPVQQLLTAEDRRMFRGRRVLVTGAGGSIGSELARQIARCGPARLTLVDHSEYNLFQIERELTGFARPVPVDPVLADVSRGALVRQAFRQARPDVVYHTAAYKHVTMSERAVCAAAMVNILGTECVLSASRAFGARFVLISSDKAAAPRSVMGATKRAAELVVTGRASAAFRPIVVRFGNVLGSSGSVLAIMRECVRARRPIPITDPAATRYFMTASEAVSLVMKADLLGAGGETYWLDMAEPVRLGDLAGRLIALEQSLGYGAVPIERIGLRPGEKLREELTHAGLEMRRTDDPRIWVASPQPAGQEAVSAALRALRRHVARADACGTLATIAELVPEFQPSVEAWATARRANATDAARPDPQAQTA